MLRVMTRNVLGLTMIAAMVYIPGLVAYNWIEGVPFSAHDSFIAGFAVMGYICLIYRDIGNSNEEEKEG